MAAASVSGPVNRDASSRAPAPVSVRSTAAKSVAPDSPLGPRISSERRVAASICSVPRAPCGEGGDRRGIAPFCAART